MNKEKVILLPCSPGLLSGYSIIVAEDCVRWGASSCYQLVLSPPNSLGKLFNVLLLRPPTRPHLKKNIVSLIKANTYHDSGTSEIIFGDIQLYIENLCYNYEVVTVRFHNLYLKLLLSCSLLKVIRLYGPKFGYTIWAFSRLEKRILLAPKIKKEFISSSDLSFAKEFCPGLVNYSVHNFQNSNYSCVNKGKHDSRTLVWVGGLSTHKLRDLKLFIEQVYRRLRLEYPSIRLLLYGKGTKKLNAPYEQIYGYGICFEKNVLSGDYIYINPDTSGLGLKVKIHDLMKAGRFFITTPEGYLGYEHIIYNNKIVAPLSSWVDIMRGLMFLNG